MTFIYIYIYKDISILYAISYVVIFNREGEDDDGLIEQEQDDSDYVNEEGINLKPPRKKRKTNR